MLTLIIVVVYTASISGNPQNGRNGWFVPQINGTFIWIDRTDAEANLERLTKMQTRVSLNPVNFYLYTYANPYNPQEIFTKKSSINASYFNPNNPTRFTIHGWNGDHVSFGRYGLCEAWFQHGDCNVISVDWGRARSPDYASSVVAVPGVGEKIANLINFLRKYYGLSLDNTMIVGHSLGAHVAGHAGKNVKNGQLHTIIGLDPALPLISYDKPNCRLNSNDAKYVESIQTCGGLLGFLKPIGKAAFYPNGGQIQPGCGIDLAGNCAHSRSVQYYAEAVRRNNFPTVKCAGYEAAISKRCGNTYSTVLMGAPTNAYYVDGDFYVPVNGQAPFGMGA